MVCFVPWFKSLGLLWVILNTTVYGTDTFDVRKLQQLIRDGLYMIRTTPRIFQQIRQSVTVQTCNILLWSFIWILQSIFFSLQEPELREHATGPLCSCNIFLLYCNMDWLSVDSPFFFFVWVLCTYSFNYQRDGRRHIHSLTLFKNKVILSM
jgi:hypothetical protein